MKKDYYFLRNNKTNEIFGYKENEFISVFGGEFEQIVSNFHINTYLEKGIKIPTEEVESVFFMNFVNNWNTNKEKDSIYTAIYTSDLTEKENISFTNINSITDTEESKCRNRKNKSAGNGEGSLYYSEVLECWVFQYYEPSGKRKTIKQLKKETVKNFKDRVAQIRVSLNTGTYIEKRNDTVKTIITTHIEQKYNDGITKGNAYNRDKETLKQIEKCCSNFLDKPIQRVSLADIQFSKENMKKYAQSGINRMWRLLKKAFSIASSPSVKLITFNLMNDENLKKPIAI